MLDVTYFSRGTFTTALLIELPKIALYYIANKTKKKINLFTMEWKIFSKYTCTLGYALFGALSLVVFPLRVTCFRCFRFC